MLSVQLDLIITLCGYDNQNSWIYVLVFGACNTVFAVFMLTMDRYFLACKPLSYSTLITKKRLLYGVKFSWILSGTLVFITSPPLYQFIHASEMANKMFLIALLTIICFFMIITIIVEFKTWQTVCRHESDAQSIRQQIRTLSGNLQHRAEMKRLKNERRFAKIVLLLVINLFLVIVPQMLTNGMKLVNMLCDPCFKEISNPNIVQVQLYMFPIFYVTTPVLYIAIIPKYRKS